MNYKIKGLEVEITDEQLDELIKERENKGKFWKPEYGEDYWHADLDGVLDYKPWTGDEFDLRRYNTGNCFKTQSEAEEKLKYNDAVIAVNVKIRELNDGWKPDWSDEDQYQFHIFFNYYSSKFSVAENSQVTEFSILNFVKSKEIANQVIEECAEELEIIKNYNLK